ncbi:MAG TPA: HYExAFE family protein [Phycisphaerales bacterium]|nr:HYExAFE family protein [Phycisphaerales bacterium]
MHRPPDHYERAFVSYLRSRRIPYVAVDEARKTLLPTDHSLKVSVADAAPGTSPTSHTLKSFDYVLYGPGCNLLVEVKGRKVPHPKRTLKEERAPLDLFARPRKPTLQSWVGMDDVESLKIWQQLFGPEFRATFVFVYWWEGQPADGLFQETFECDGSWYGVRSCFLSDYVRCMKLRSPRWRTVHVLSRDFERISHPLTPTLNQTGLEAPMGGEPVYAPL